MTPDEQASLAEKLRPIWAAFDTLTEEASRGNQEAIRVLAEAGEPRAIAALAAIAADDQQQPLWYLAAKALRKPAESGDSGAIDALVGMSRSTNHNTLHAVRVGLGAAAANANPKALQALRQIDAARNHP